MTAERIRAHLDHARRVWTESALPALTEYIAVPALSPAFDPDWEVHGHLERAMGMVAAWCEAREVPGLRVEVVRLPGRTPLLVLEVPATRPWSGPGPEPTVLLYGHCDKQPDMAGWHEGLGPWSPVRRGDRLYGRGGADDGYSAFASVAALESIHAQGLDHARCLVLIEASEESGSSDLPAHVDALADRIGTRVDLVLCLDSGCATYDHLWVTSSLRGMCSGVLRVEALREGVHSGDAGGLVADTFRVVRTLLDRVEDAATGEILLREAYAPIPERRVGEAAAAAVILGEQFVARDYPLLDEIAPMPGSAADLVLARTWKPTLAVTGADGLPPTAGAGNVLRPSTALRLALRLAPGADPEAAHRALVAAVTVDVPYGFHVTFDADAQGGWDAPPTSPWLDTALHEAASAVFGSAPQWMGEGGSIPFIGMLARRYPDAQFVVTGVLGPESNAHGPNEFLHVPTAERLTAVLSHVLEAHAAQCSGG